MQFLLYILGVFIILFSFFRISCCFFGILFTFKESSFNSYTSEEDDNSEEDNNSEEDDNLEEDDNSEKWNTEEDTEEDYDCSVENLCEDDEDRLYYDKFIALTKSINISNDLHARVKYKEILEEYIYINEALDDISNIDSSCRDSIFAEQKVITTKSNLDSLVCELLNLLK